MIFAHAPVILPGVAGVTMAFSRRFYGHLVLLHASLLLRVAGDLALAPEPRRWGGLLNAAAVAVFLVQTALAVRRTRQPDRAAPGVPVHAAGSGAARAGRALLERPE